jgi:hypothetical protein
VLEDIVGLTLVLLFVAVMMFGWKTEADDSGVSLKLLSRYVVARVAYREIAKVERVNWKCAWLMNLRSLTGRRQWNWGAGLFGDRVVIHRRDGTLFIMTPRDPDQFLREVENRRAAPR